MTTQEIHGYASYGIRLTRRQALRALIRRSRQLDVSGSQVSVSVAAQIEAASAWIGQRYGGSSSFGPVRAHSYEQELDITASDLSEAFTALQLADDRHGTDVSAAQRLWNYLWDGRFGGSDVADSAAAVPDGIIKADTKLTEQEAEEIRQRFAAATASTLSRMTGGAGESDQPAADFARQLADDVAEVLRPGTRCESCGRFLPRDRQHICPKAGQS